MTAPLDRLTAALADRYRIIRELGGGGMASVFVAEDLRHGRDVAVKVLHPELAFSVGVERFLTEIRTTARLQHPHILPLYDSGEADRFLFYVMPLVEGESLRERLDRAGPLPADQALHIATDVAGALEYAHQHGVIHRDIKPENILIIDGHPLLADFGIARALSAAGNPRMTASGTVVGTPAYMSPEQASGEEEIDARSDQYSLACVLFEMLTGEPPFLGSTASAVLLQRFTRTPPRLASKRPGLPRHLDAAVHRALSRDRDERFPSLARFAEALRAPAGPPVPARLERSIAVLPFANLGGAPEDEYLSDGITEEIINTLTQLEGIRVAARTSAFAFKGRNEDLREVGEKLGVATVLEGSVRRAGSRLRVTAQMIDVSDGYHLWSERYDREMTDVFAIQDEIAGAIATRLRGTFEAGRARRSKPGTESLEAYELFLKGRALLNRRGREIPEALRCFHQALELDPQFAEAHAWLADAWRLLAVFGHRSPAEAMPCAKRAATRAVELDPSLAEAHATLADVALLHDRDFAAAEASWRKALELNPSHVRARAEWALWWLTAVRGDFEAGLRESRAAIEADPLSSWAESMHALTAGLAGRFDEAREAARRAVELDPEAFLGRWAVVETAMWLGDHAAAVEAAEPALLMSGRHPWVLASLALAHARAGRHDVARALYDELEARSRTGFVQPFWLATAALAAGRTDEAVALARRSATERDPLIMLVKHMPEWGPLQSHPALQEVLRLASLL